MDPHISTLESDVATVRANVEAIHASYATKDALRDSEHRLSLRIEAVRGDLHVKIVETQAALELKIANGLAAQELKMTELKRDMAALSSELRTWFLGTAIAMLVGFGGMSVALFNALKP